MNDRLLNEDCLVGMQRLADHSIDLILTDLPYGTTRNAWDSVIPLAPLWEQYKRVLKPCGCAVLFAACPFDKVLGASNLPWLKYEWIWEKDRATGVLNSHYQPLKRHETILVFSPAAAAHRGGEK